jgi:hypothetical protein
MFCIVFFVWNAIFIFVSLNSLAIFLVSFPLYVKEIVNILEIILEQNYFEFNKQFYKQTEGLAMGAMNEFSSCHEG